MQEVLASGGGRERGDATEVRRGDHQARRPVSNKAIVGSGQCVKHQGRWTRQGIAQVEAKQAKAKMQELRKKKWGWW